MSTAVDVIWHDLECGGYHEDQPLWRELADAAGGPVLDVGAGGGRVTRELARAGTPVVALDADPVLCNTLRERAAGLPVEVVRADARDFELGRRFPLVIVPMQTVQLLGGRDGRAAFLRCAHAHLEPGGLLAVALADALESFEAEDDLLPAPDESVEGATWYTSRPVAVVDEGHCAAIHRLREIVTPDGARSESIDVIRLDRVDAAEHIAETVAAGFAPAGARRIPETEQYVGSTVVLARAS
jgi:SAM-dependent methyltransferase